VGTDNLFILTVHLNGQMTAVRSYSYLQCKAGQSPQTPFCFLCVCVSVSSSSVWNAQGLLISKQIKAEVPEIYNPDSTQTHTPTLHCNFGPVWSTHKFFLFG